MLRIAVCDDQTIYVDSTCRMIEEWAFKRHFNIQLGKFSSGENLIADIEESGYFDIVLLDIELRNGMNGLVTAAKIKEIYSHICLIFISQYNHYYKEIFEVHPFHYLEKPAQKKKLFEILDQAVDHYKYLNEIYVFRFKGRTYSIILREVLYFLSDKRIIRVIMEGGEEYTFYEKLDVLENKLKRYRSFFLRIHKSYLVNSSQVEQYHARHVMMRNKDILPISVDKKESVNRFHMELLEKNF